MLTNVCTTTGTPTTTCTTCTGQPAIAPVPAHVIDVPNPGWNAGANSIQVLDGDLYAQWTVAAGSAGAVCGFAAAPREDVTDVRGMTHGWYAFTQSGLMFAQPYETGYTRATAVAITPTSVLRIERADAQVTYLLDDATYYTSTAPSRGPVLVGATLYAPGDAIV